MSEFDTAKFLDLLSDACVEVEVRGEQFQADPNILGPRLLAASKSFEKQKMYLDALLENRWVVYQSPDGLWRVWSLDTGGILKGQRDGYKERLEALDLAIIAKHTLKA